MANNKWAHKLYLIAGWQERLKTLSPEQLKSTIQRIENVRDTYVRPPTTREEREKLRAAHPKNFKAKAAGAGK